MIHKILMTTLISCYVALVLAACGSEEPSDTGSDGDTDTDADGDSDTDTDSNGDANDYYPMKVGDYWVYKETSDSGSIELTYTVTGTKKMTIDGQEKELFVVENTFDSLNERRIQFIEDDGVRAVRHSHEVYDTDDVLTKTRSFSPGFLRFDRGRMTVGEKWEETITRYTNTQDGTPTTEDSVTYQFTVISTDEAVETEAGSFQCYAMQRLNKTDPNQELKVYFYAPGIGKVRELTADKEEILIRSSYLN